MMRRRERLARERRQGLALLALVATMAGGLLYGAAVADSARGMSPSASLASWGL